MSECIKGKLEAIYNTIYRKQTYIGGCVGYFERTVLGDDVNEANAKELVRRWNAFESGGIVEELRTACEEMMKTWNQPTTRSMFQLKIDMDIAYEKLEAALAKI